jgi:hypothetical protein
LEDKEEGDADECEEHFVGTSDHDSVFEVGDRL